MPMSAGTHLGPLHIYGLQLRTAVPVVSIEKCREGAVGRADDISPIVGSQIVATHTELHWPHGEPRVVSPQIRARQKKLRKLIASVSR